MPVANIFSIGDVLLGAGVAMTIALAMRRPVAPAPSEPGRTAGVTDSSLTGNQADTF
jgi:hypothetical protein